MYKPNIDNTALEISNQLLLAICPLKVTILHKYSVTDDFQLTSAEQGHYSLAS
jgi:hypothetical protein